MVDFIYIEGLKRSGLHLFVNWVMALYTSPRFVNNIHPTHPQQTANKINKKMNKGVDAIIVLCEDPCQAHNNLAFQIVNELNISANIYEFLLVRDPYNWIASYIRRYSVDTKRREVHGSTFFNDYNKNSMTYFKLWLEVQAKTKKYTMRICYNCFMNQGYFRKAIANVLHRTLYSKKEADVFNTMAHTGSSFDLQAINDKSIEPKQMAVFHRWHKYLKPFVSIETVPKFIKQLTHECYQKDLYV